MEAGRLLSNTEEALSTAGVLHGDTLHLAVTQPNNTTQQSQSPHLRDSEAERPSLLVEHPFLVRGVSPAPEFMWQRGVQIGDAGRSSNAAMLERENASMLLTMGTPHGFPRVPSGSLGFNNASTTACEPAVPPHRCFYGLLPWPVGGAVFNRDPHVTTHQTRHRPRSVCQYDADADRFHTRRWL